MTKDLPSPEFLRNILCYDAETGAIHFKARSPEMFQEEGSSQSRSWRAARWNSRHAGKEAMTSISSSGYLVGYVLWKRLSSHRVAFCLHYGRWPNGQIDHKNGIRTDNRIVNLRDVSQIENSRNMKLNSKNKSGVSGVHWNKREGKWKSIISDGQKKVCLGTFSRKEDAIIARKKAEKIYGYDKNHGRIL